MVVHETTWPSAGLLQRLQVFSRLESDSLAGGDADFRAGAGIASDAGLPWFDRKDAKAPEFNPFVAFQGILHLGENGVDSLLGFGFADTSSSDDLID